MTAANYRGQSKETLDYILSPSCMIIILKGAVAVCTGISDSWVRRARAMQMSLDMHVGKKKQLQQQKGIKH
jgi:hypothetical protein